MPPPTNSNGGDTSAPLPNQSGRYQGTTPTTWLNFNTPCKSQLKNAWPCSPTTIIRDILPVFFSSLGAVSNSDVGGHGFPLFPVSCSFDDLDFTDFQQLAEAFHEVQPWSSSASLALNFPSDYDVLKSMLSHDMSQETHLPRSDSVHQFPPTLPVT